MDIRAPFTAAPPVKSMINIGGLFDIPTGDYITGEYGQSVLNGGLGTTMAVVGIGNHFKSTILHYMSLSALDRIQQSTPSSLSTYDTEINISEKHLNNLAQSFPTMKDKVPTNDGTWTITDKTVYFANEWYEVLKKYLKDKKAAGKEFEVDLPFIGRDGKTKLKVPVPTFSEIDSFSEFQTEDVAEIADKNELGDSGGNTIHMRQGLAKTRFLMEIGSVASQANHYVLMTAHIGKEIQMATGPIPAPPVKKLQHLKHGDKIKGVTDKFFFLTTCCYQTISASPFINNGTKGPEYPINPDDNAVGDTDLNLVTLRILRNKNGLTGNTITVLVSQSKGLLPSLSEFHYLKESNRFGISGTMQHYNLDLLPDVKLSRTTVRNKIDNDPKLRRVLNITSEMLQMREYWRHLDDEFKCNPDTLYKDIKDIGYDWDTLLNSRGWWTINDSKHKVPFLSTMDLLRMRLSKSHPKHYIPYWYPKDKVKELKFK